MRKLITTAAAAEKLGVTKRHIQELCNSGRIPQASRLGRDWLMPDNFRVLPVRRGRPPIIEAEIVSVPRAVPTLDVEIRDPSRRRKSKRK